MEQAVVVRIFTIGRVEHAPTQVQIGGVGRVLIDTRASGRVGVGGPNAQTFVDVIGVDGRVLYTASMYIQ